MGWNHERQLISFYASSNVYTKQPKGSSGPTIQLISLNSKFALLCSMMLGLGFYKPLSPDSGYWLVRLCLSGGWQGEGFGFSSLSIVSANGSHRQQLWSAPGYCSSRSLGIPRTRLIILPQKPQQQECDGDYLQRSEQQLRRLLL